MQPVQMAPVVQGNTAVLYGRITDIDNAPLLRADIASITVKSYNMGDRANAVASDAPDVASVIFNTLQPWPTGIPGFTAPDTVGYNARYETLATFFPQGNQNYQVEMIATTTAGKPRSQIWHQPTLDLFQQ